MSSELQYLAVVVGLFLAPRLLQRLRIPSAITCVSIGAALGMGAGLFHDDPAVPLLATLGIVSLFLFAGLEVDFSELRRGWAVTVGHLVLQVGLLAGATVALGSMFQLAWRPALLLSLSLLTPSTGFILDSLPGFGLTSNQQYWVKTKAIATELLALVALFFVVQSSSARELAISSLVLGGMIAVLPLVFHLFASRVLPYAPRSEFTFLLILALICAFVTRRLGVYYLVGAFVVGVTAVRLRKRVPALMSERLLIGIELFASFFIPFYFFKAGLHLEAHYFTLESVAIGLAFVAVGVPLRVAVVAIYRRLALRESWRASGRVGLSLVPTLVFTMVLAEIAHQRFALSDTLFGALIVFALVNTALPGFFLRTAVAELMTPEAPRHVTGEVPTVAGDEPSAAHGHAGH